MSREQTLLERLSNPQERGRSYQPTATEDVEALMESVRVNLERIINSRHGMSECLPDYGLPALSDLTVGVNDYVQIMRDAIQSAIEQYEPRLRNVRVSRAKDEDQGRSLSFRVDALLVGRTGEHRVWYQTSISGDGQFDVDG